MDELIPRAAVPHLLLRLPVLLQLPVLQSSNTGHQGTLLRGGRQLKGFRTVTGGSRGKNKRVVI